MMGRQVAPSDNREAWSLVPLANETDEVGLGGTAVLDGPLIGSRSESYRKATNSDETSYGWDSGMPNAFNSVKTESTLGPLANAEDVKLGFKNFSVSIGGNAVVKDAIGYVRKGGLTAVLGPSASGKSVLLKTLAGHTRTLVGASASGSAFLNGAPLKSTWAVALQPQDNSHLIGVLTVRESLNYSLKLKKPRMSQQERDARVNEVLSNLGLNACQDTQIGTIYKRGISGGQQRRVAIGVEVVYLPEVLCLDEPTSGLDTTTAINTIKYLRRLLAESKGQSGYLMTIHQPNAELLSLFDDVILMVGGGTVYSGTVAGATAHFNAIAGTDVRVQGVPVTETHLRLADTTFSNPELLNGRAQENYPARFAESAAKKTLDDLLKSYSSGEPTPVAGVSFGDHVSNFLALFWRMYLIAKRDLTLFHVQYVLQGQYGFMIGLIFYQRRHEIGQPTVDMTSSLLWLSALSLYVYVFKSYYNATQYSVTKHEDANAMYGGISSTLSELAVLMMAVPGYIPATALGWFMIGFPAEGFPFMILFIFVASFAAEAVPAFVAHFTRDDASKALMVTQGLLLIFFIFAGGAFIREEEMPSYWKWLQAISPFEHGVKAVNTAAFEYLELDCPAPYIQDGGEFGYQPSVTTNGYGSCVTLDVTYPCDLQDTGGPNGCKVKGSTTLHLLNQYDTDKFESLLYLFFIGLALRIVNLILRYYSPDAFFNSIYALKSAAANARATAAPLSDYFAPGTNVTFTSLKAASPTSGTPSVLSFRNVEVHIEKKLLTKPKTILADVSGVVTGGRLCALMGPSGSGKTTLLNALSGRALYANVNGRISLDGHKLNKRHFAYVPQIDSLNPNFTVKETLTSAVRLRCADGWADLDTRVHELMEIVGLVSVADLRTGKLTGGQLKLLSVALGLVQRPAVLYLDEPTTGLDSTAASVVMEYLSGIAKTGVVTLLTVHQPSKSVFDLVDDVILLGADGSLAFSGPTSDAMSFFSAEPFNIVFPADENPADILIEAVSGLSRNTTGIKTNVVVEQPLRRISAMYRESDINARLTAQLDQSEKNPREANDVPSPGFGTRMSVLISKTMKLYWREPGAYLYMGIVVTLFSVFLGTLYYNLEHDTSALREVRASMFLAIWMALYFSLISIPVNCQERNEAVRMVASNHCTQAEWCLAQFIAQLPFSFSVSFILTACFHFLTNINDSGEVFVFMLLNLWLLHMLFAAVSWNIIEVVVNPMLATTASMSILGMFFLFAGFFVLVPDLVPVIRWMPYTVATLYSLSGTQYAYFNGVDYTSTSSNGTQVIVSGDSILRTQLDVNYDFEERYWLDLLIVFAFLLLFRVQHWMLFWKHTKDLGVTSRGTKTWWEKDCCRDVCGC
eukprot:m.100041 g.100041  ORF g.100041 m.100041 type:complete len:1366 (-) comp12475_c0_seq12:70-4167(-)